MVLAAFAIVNIAFFFAGLWCLMRGEKDWLLRLFAVSLALSGVMTFAGTIWTPTKVVGLFCVGATIIAGARKGRYNQHVGLFLVAVAISVASAYAWMPTRNVTTFSLHGALLRPLVQAYNYVSAACVFMMLLDTIRDERSTSRLLAIVFWSTCFGAFVAYLHLACIKLGLPFLPIPRFDGSESEVAAFSGAGGTVLRVYGIAGEPKQLATFLVPGCLVQVFCFLQGGAYLVPGRAAFFASILTLPIIYLTYSTGAYVSMAIGLAVVLWYTGRVSTRQFTRLIGFIGVCCFAASLLVVFKPDLVESLSENFEQRLTRRLEADIDDRLEVGVLKYMFWERTETTIFGLGPGMYNYHGFGGVHEGQGLQPMTSLWVIVFSDLGLVGLGLVITLVNRVVELAISMQKRRNAPLVGAALGGVVGNIVIGVSTGHIGTLFFFAGLVVASVYSTNYSPAVRLQSPLDGGNRI